MQIEYIFISSEQVSFKTFLKSIFGNVSEKYFKVELEEKEYKVFYNYITSKSESLDTQEFMYFLTISMDEQEEEKCAEVLNSANKKILGNKDKKQYHVIRTYDGVSKYYCDHAYPQLNEFERNIRNLIFKILTKAFGSKWFERTATDEQKKKLSRCKKSLREEILYEMSIKDLEDYLFTPMRDVSCEQMIDNILSEDNITQMTKEQIELKLKDARPKSLWERQFAPKISIDQLQENLERIRHLRNKVAHAKVFTCEDFYNCQSITKNLNKKIRQAIDEVSVKEYNVSETVQIITRLGYMWESAFSKAVESNLEIPKALLEMGSSIKKVYQALNNMPSLKESGALNQLAEITSTISALQKASVLEFQKMQDVIRSVSFSPLTIRFPKNFQSISKFKLPINGPENEADKDDDFPKDETNPEMKDNDDSNDC
ncbi:MAG TPA: hypothetical protein PKW23_00385 [Dictyoglomaceae bacterium]|nr:hypothetical protein [Dictyoglomaceae bacterium]HOL39183.1 hypothetical protein [Dictyoglomaceae bacterium]HPP15337.1 hypothetical protein [Dictyoglomaceae bacterium]